MPEICVTQRTAEWLAAREGRVTASLAAACLRLGAHGATPMKAWREIVGKRTEAEKQEYVRNRHLQWGVQFESAAKLDYEVHTGHMIVDTGFWVHPDYPWLGASPDGLIGSDGLVEVKCPTECPTKVPTHHRIQCIIQLLCTGRQWCDYWSWGASGRRFLDRLYLRSEYPGLIARLKAFYETYVLTGICPPRKKARRKCRPATDTPTTMPSPMRPSVA